MSFTDDKWRMYNDYQAQHGLRSVWSIYKVESFHDLSGIAADTLVYSEHWGERPVEVQLPFGMKTWGELYAAADSAIRQSGDNHHVYIEHFRVEDGRAYLMTGS